VGGRDFFKYLVYIINIFNHLSIMLWTAVLITYNFPWSSEVVEVEKEDLLMLPGENTSKKEVALKNCW
jgi:hypothetical protein